MKQVISEEFNPLPPGKDKKVSRGNVAAMMAGNKLIVIRRDVVIPESKINPFDAGI